MSPYQVVLVSASFLLLLEATVAPFSPVGATIPDQQIEPKEKPLPPGAIARLGSLRLRHEHEVCCSAFSPDGKMIASVADHHSKIRVWDTATGKLLHEFAAPGIFSGEFFRLEDFTLAFTPDGKSIAAGVGPDICFWDWQSGREVRRFRGKGKGILALTFSPDGKTFYCGGADNKFYQWDIASGKQLRSWDYFEGKQPRLFATGSAEKTAHLKAVTPDGKTAVWSVCHWAVFDNGRSHFGQQLTIWDATTGTDCCKITDKNGKDFFAARVVLSSDGKYLAAYDLNTPLIVWDAATGKKHKTLGAGDSVSGIAYSHDCRRVAVITCGGGYRFSYKLSVWDLATGNELWHRELAPWYAPGRNKSLTFSADGKILALADWKNVRIWDVESAKETPLLEGHRWPVRHLAFAPKDGALISADYASVCEWNTLYRQTSRHSLITYHGHSRSMAESYETKVRIYQPEGKPPQLRELVSDKLLWEFDELKGGCDYGCFSTDGRTVAFFRSGKEQEIIFFDVPSRKLRSSLTTDASISGNLILTGDGKMLAVSCSDQTVVLVDSFKGEIIRRLGTPQSPPKENDPRINLTRGAFSSDGQLVAFGTHLDRPGDHWKWKFGMIDEIKPDPPGIRVWRVDSGRELKQFDNCMADAPHGRIVSLRFSPDNKSLAVGLNFNPSQVSDPEQAAVPVLEVASGQLRRRFKGHTDEVAAVAFSADGKILATGSADSTILLWDMNRPVSAELAAKQSADEQLKLHWSKLAEQDSVNAYDAVLALTEMADQCVAFLAQRLKPIESLSNEQLEKLIVDLDSSSFKVRQESFAKLVALNDLARPALKKAIQGKVSLELHRRLKEIVDPIDAMHYSPGMMRELRSVEVLERIASKDARRVLERLADGAAEAILTIEAKAALVRLNHAD